MTRFLPKKDYRAAYKPQLWLVSKREGKKAAPQAAAITKRGGGETGSRERGRSNSFANSIGDLMATTVAAAMGGGSTKATEVSSARSESWQQDIAQAIIPGISCPQSM
jgi:hypothetical protein